MKKKNTSVSKLFHRLAPHRGLLALALLSAVVSISLTLLIPVLVGQAVDNIIDRGKVYFDAVLRIILYIAAAIVGVSVCQWLMNCLVNVISFRIVRDLRRDIFPSAASLMMWTRWATVLLKFAYSSFRASSPSSAR